MYIKSISVLKKSKNSKLPCAPFESSVYLSPVYTRDYPSISSAPPPSADCPVSSVCQTVVSLLLSTYLVYTSDGTRGINGEWTFVLRVWSCQLANKMYTWCSSILVWWVHACVHADWVRITEVTQHFGYFRAIRMLSLIFLSQKEGYSQQRAASEKKILKNGILVLALSIVES